MCIIIATATIRSFGSWCSLRFKRREGTKTVGDWAWSPDHIIREAVAEFNSPELDAAEL